MGSIGQCKEKSVDNLCSWPVRISLDSQNHEILLKLAFGIEMWLNRG